MALALAYRGSHMLTDYLIVAGVAFAATVMVLPLVKRLARTVGAVSYPEARRIHTTPTPVLGGLGMFVGVIAGFLVGSRLGSFSEVFGQTSDPEAVLLAAAVVVLLGVVDDVKGMAAPVKLAGQLLAGALLVMFGMSLLFIYLPGNPGSIISLTPDLSTLLTVASIVIMINAVNLADGLDGLAAGMVGIGAIALLIYVETAENAGTILLGTPTVAPLILCALVGVCAGFLMFNFHPASVFMGDTGSMLLGLLLAGAAIAALEVVVAPSRSDIAALSVPVLVPALVLAVPLIDTVWAIGRRVRTGGSVFAPDKRHVHHRLVEMGHSQRRAVLMMYYWSAVFALVGVGTSVLSPKTAGLALLGAIAVAVAFAMVSRLRAAERRSRRVRARDHPVESEIDHTEPMTAAARGSDTRPPCLHAALMNGPADQSKSGDQMGVAVVAAVQLVISILVWFVVGRLLDLALSTGPWFTFAGALLGSWVGILLTWRRGQANAPEAGPPTPASVEKSATAAGETE